MSTIRQIFACQIQLSDLKSALANFGLLTRRGGPEIGRPLGAVLVFATILTVLVAALWLASNSLYAMQVDYKAQQDLLDILQRRGLDAGVAMRRTAGATGDPFLSAPTETLAAAALDDEIRRVANNMSDTVTSSHPEVDHDTQSAGNKIEIKAVIDGKIDALQALLFQLETGTPLVLVNEISLETRSESIDGNGAGTNPDVHMAATFVAYWHSPTKRKMRR